jgi:hypothetical protein
MISATVMRRYFDVRGVEFPKGITVVAKLALDHHHDSFSGISTKEE